MLTRLRVEFIDLREYRYRRKFNSNSPECACSLEEWNNEHFLFRCPLYSHNRLILFNSILKLTHDVDITFVPPHKLCSLLFFFSFFLSKCIYLTINVKLQNYNIYKTYTSQIQIRYPQELFIRTCRPRGHFPRTHPPLGENF